MAVNASTLYGLEIMRMRVKKKHNYRKGLFVKKNILLTGEVTKGQTKYRPHTAKHSWIKHTSSLNLSNYNSNHPNHPSH